MALNKIRANKSICKHHYALWARKSHGNFETREQFEAHRDSLKKYNKAGFDYEYLFGLEKHQLVYKVIRLQRQIDSYTIMKSVTNVDGRDKIRVDHPEPEDVIDHFAYHRRRVAFKVAYLGWDYMGYAWSSFADRGIKGHTNNVERVFLEALLRQQISSSVGREVNLDRAGRTDAGVSGSAQVICVNVRSNLNEGFGVFRYKTKKERDLEKQQMLAGGTLQCETTDEIPNYLKYSVKDRSQDANEIPYVKLLNEALPRDIRVLAWSPVPVNFSPRGGCIGRTYRYYFPRGDLDVDLMNEVAQKLVGEHNFENFGAISSENMEHTFTKVLRRFEISVIPNRQDPELPECDICCATISSSGFIYRQVRLMMAVLFSIGNGDEDPAIIDDLLDTDKIKSRPSYAGLGSLPLILHDAVYNENDIDWRWDSESLKSVASSMGELWSQNAMKSEIVRTIYKSSLENLCSNDKMSVRNSVHWNVIRTDPSMAGRSIMEMDRAKNAKEFRAKEVDRAVRRLQRKGRYSDAKDVKAGTSDTYIGWTSERRNTSKFIKEPASGSS